MEHTNEMERWRLEIELDRLQTELAEARLVLARVDELHHLLRTAIVMEGRLFIGSVEQSKHTLINQALARLQETYSTYARNRYPDGRP